MTAMRPLTADDLPLIATIEQRVSPFPWSERQFSDSLESHYCWVLEHQGQVGGYIIFAVVGDVAEILTIAVLPELQGQGYGKRLLAFLQVQVAEPVRSLFLEVRAGNFAAINLYLTNGFNQIGERRDYYRTAHGSEDALLMAKELVDDSENPNRH